MKRIILFLLIIIIISSLASISYAGMADWTDEDADKAANEQLKQQELVIEQGKGKSDNNYLSILEIKGYKISPQFNKENYNYTIEEEINDDIVEIKAEAEDSKSTISGDGKVDLQSGRNEIKIIVKAENGFMRSYFLYVNKKVAQAKINNLKLQAIEKNNDKYEIELNQAFDKNIYNYNCEVLNDVEKINVDIQQENENDKVEIIGNDNLKEGKNTIIIKLKNSEDDNDTTYKIEVLKKERVPSSDNKNEEKDNKAVLIAGTCAGGTILILSIFTIIKAKKKTKH